MRIFVMSTGWTILVDVVSWGVIHLGVSFLFTQIPRERFDPGHFFFKPFFWESARWYEKVFWVKRWKQLIPDAAPWFPGGFPKRSLAARSHDYFFSFAQETCRGELVHWVTLCFAPFFFLWNSPSVGGVLTGYALIANLPCILIQRVNRCRFMGLVKRYV